jgi:hypothetical protein
MTRRLRQERNFDILFRVLLVLIAQKPVPIIERQDPGSVDGDRVATKVLGLQNSRELDVALQISSEPFLVYAGVSSIELKSPVAG